MKLTRIVACVLSIVTLAFCFAGCSNSNQPVLRIYNWGEYIGDGIIEQFEAETGIKVVYDTFNDNESLYAKVKNGGEDAYDIIIPSDYMVKKMIDEDMLAELNYNNIPNFKNIEEGYTGLSFDETNTYSVPYLVDTVGILYNTDLVDGEITKMADMFDEKYSRKICMLYSMRDTIGMTLKMLGYSMNDIDENHINEARDMLIKQKPHVLAYGTDEIPPKVMNGTAAMALVYSGEGLNAVSIQPENLKFVVPEEGRNLAIDNMVILKSSSHKTEAETFINFMLRADIAAKNALDTGYATPNKAGKELLPEEIKNDPVRYPSAEVLQQCEIYSSDNKYYVDAWNLIVAN